MLANLPNDVMRMINEQVAMLFQIIHGFMPDSLNSMLGIQGAGGSIDALIAKIKALLNPVIGTFSKLSLPAPPVIAPVFKLLEGSPAPTGDNEDLKNQVALLKNSLQPPSSGSGAGTWRSV